MVMIMGTTICHMVMGDEDATGRGHVRRRRGRHPARALRLRGRPVGRRRHLRLVRRQRRARRPTTRQAQRAGRRRAHRPGARGRQAARPARSGLVALDWWNGNRSILVDADLSGLLVGATLATTAAGDLPRPDRGDRLRHARDHRGLRGRRRAGRRDRRLRRAARSATGCSCRSTPTSRRRISVAASPQTPALGSAMFGAVAAGAAAGGYDRIEDAAARMARLRDERYEPDRGRRRGLRRALRRVPASCTTPSAAATTTP